MQKDDVIYRQEAIAECNKRGAEHIGYAIAHLPSAQPTHNNTSNALKSLDCIDRQAAIDAIHCDITVTGRQNAELVAATIGTFADRIKALPSAQPERKCGRWEMLQIPISPPVYKCSVCGSHALQTLTGCLMNRHYESNLTKFCPNCGADMREGEADG